MARPKRPENRTPNERLLRATWMTAYERGELTLRFESPTALYRTRFQLNSDAKAHKEYPDIDPDYAMAVQVLGIESDMGKLELRIGAVVSNTLSRSLSEALGQDTVDQLLQDTSSQSTDIANSSQRLQELLGSHGQKMVDPYAED